jgi:hypothetical protein
MWSLPSGSSPTTSGAAFGKADGAQGDREPCRYFLNGGCLRGDACPFSHEFPDERHLDVNNVGFIFTSNVQNSAVALQRRYQQQLQQPVHQHSPSPQGLRDLNMGQPSMHSVQSPPTYGGGRTHHSPPPQAVAQPIQGRQPSASAQAYIPQAYAPITGATSAQPPQTQPSAPQQQQQQQPPPPQQPQYTYATQAAPTSSIYTYGGSVGQPISVISPHQSQQLGPHLVQSGAYPPHQLQPAMVAQPVAYQPAQPGAALSSPYAQQASLAPQPQQLTVLQPPVRGSGIGPIPVQLRTDPGPYHQPAPLAYALPPQLLAAYQYVGLPAGAAAGYGSYSASSQQAVMLAHMLPVTTTAAA